MMGTVISIGNKTSRKKSIVVIDGLNEGGILFE